MGKLGERIEVGGGADGMNEEGDVLGLDMVVGPLFGPGGRTASGVGFGAVVEVAVVVVVDGSLGLAGSDPRARLAVCGGLVMLGSWGEE